MFTIRLLIPVAALIAATGCNTAAPDGGDEQIPVGETGGMCGGYAGFQCNAEADYCAYETGVCVNIADGAGVCTPRPDACTMQYDPVCGCDGETYSNECVAATGGVSVAYKGECKAETE